MSSESSGGDASRQARAGVHGPPPDDVAEQLRRRRAKTSCVPCRKQKLKCGCEPPLPCNRCKARGSTCIWPKEDRRSTRFRSVTEGSQSSREPVGRNVDPRPRHDATRMVSSIGNELAQYQTPYINSVDNGWLQALFGNDLLPAIPLLGVDDISDATGASGPMNVLDLTIGGPSGLGGFHFMGVNIFLQDRPTPAPDGSPAVGVTEPVDQYSQETLLGLLDVFTDHFGAQFPCVDVGDIRDQIRRRTGSQFLLYSLCGLAARFSHDPAIALSHLNPSQYGDVFTERARAMVGLVLSVPILETVMGFLLLALGINGKGAASELWMISGLATRMALDMGLHMDTAGVDHADIARSKQLVFWSVFALDLMVSIGLGRSTTILPSSISQPLPNQDSLPCRAGLPNPFPYFAHVMYCAARVNNRLNNQLGAMDGEGDLSDIVDEIMSWYQQLPWDLQWSPKNLAAHNAAQQGHCMINLHLWFHTILLMALSVSPSNMVHGQKSTAQPKRDSADVIREIVDACELLTPTPCLDLPLICQPLYTAAMVYLKSLQEEPNNGQESSLASARLRRHVASLQAAFVQLETYWMGVHSIAAILDQRVRGSVNVDFSDADESRASVDMFPWSLPDRYSSNTSM